MTATMRRSGDVVHVAIDGRVTESAIDTLAAACQLGLDRGTGFGVVFDRRTMTAPTKDGRAALERWATDDLPRLRGRCLAWADVLDARRIESLSRAAGTSIEELEEESDFGYPQRTFSDLRTAETWVLRLLQSPLTSQEGHS